MKAVSLWQPWAGLMPLGIKTNETRSWHTPHRGPLLIHAAKKKPSTIPDLEGIFRAEAEAWEKALKALGCTRLGALDALPLGCLLGVVMLRDCELIGEDNTPPLPERAYGDYTPGRFMWKTNGARAFKTPIPFSGARGLFEVPDALVQEALA